jgi:hypothetical protein
MTIPSLTYTGLDAENQAREEQAKPTVVGRKVDYEQEVGSQVELHSIVTCSKYHHLADILGRRCKPNNFEISSKNLCSLNRSI